MNHAVAVDLKALREHVCDGLTAAQAASAAQVKRRTWQKWEKAGRIPKGALDRFCRAQQVTEDVLKTVMPLAPAPAT